MTGALLLPPRLVVPRLPLRRPLRRWRTREWDDAAVTRAAAIDKGNIGTVATPAVGIGGSTTITTTQAVASGATVIVLPGCFVSGGTGNLSVSGGGLTWAEGHFVASGNIRLELWYARAPAGLATNTALNIALGGSTSGDITACAASYLGINPAAAIQGFNGAVSSATTTWNSGFVTATGCAIGGAWADGTPPSSSTASLPGVTRISFSDAATVEQVTLVDKLSVTGTNNLAGQWNNSLTSLGIMVVFALDVAPVAVGNRLKRWRY